MMTATIVLAALKMTFPAGTAADPSAVAPLEFTATESVAFWWNEAAFHIGERAYAWGELKAKPEDGATFRIELPDTKLREKNWLEGKIDLSASKYRIAAFGPFGGSKVDVKAEVCVAKDGKVFSCLYGTGATQDYLNLPATKPAKKGEKVVFDLVGEGSSSGNGYYSLKDADGKPLYSVNGGYRDPKLVFDLKYVWTDIEKRVLNIRTAGWTDTPDHVLRVRAVDFMTDTVGGWTRELKLGKLWGVKDYQLSVEDLEPGFYWLHFDYLDAAGRLVHAEKQPYLRAAEKMPWDDTQLGAEDTVPPPWTQPVFGADGTFECWKRVAKLGGKGLVTSITHGGKEILASPVTLVADGKELTFDVVTEKDGVSVGSYRLKAREADVEVNVTCEFDGFMMFEAEFPTTVKSLKWRVAARRGFVTGFDDCSDERNPNIRFPKDVTPAFDFNPSQRHMWWMPGVRGLMGGVLNLHGWHAKDLAKAGRVESTADEISVTTTFVDCEMAAGPRRTVKFYLEPTPVKPKDLKLASMDETERVLWTGHVCRFFEVKYPGFECPELVRRFQNDLKAGKRVFWYNGSSGVSPEDNFWNWYSTDWHMKGLDYFAHEAPAKTKPESWRRGYWAYACLNSKSFFEYKVWGVNWYLNLCPETKDLYFDLANPHPCCNEHHGCQWKDDFGREMRDMAILRTRELHKRVYRLVKAKNADGAMFGHISSKMCPSGVFFDMACAGEGYAYDVVQNNFTYFDIYTPEQMQSFFVPRTQETVFMTPPQLLRARECWAPHLYRKYNCNTPENVRAIRHVAAYIKIHDLTMERGPDDSEGWQLYAVDAPIRKLRDGGVYSAYYLESEPLVKLSAPGPRQLWAWYAKGETGILVLLNDTDSDVTQTVSVKDLAAKGVEILDKGAFDFTSGSCTIKLPPRDARFIKFKLK